VQSENVSMTYAEWTGERPRQEDYMPVFPRNSKLGICMYEEVTEGTPISPVYTDTPEGRQAMADYLTDNPRGISRGMTADDWLAVIGGYLTAIDIHTGKIESR
jgi:hypothetical protein